MAKNKFIDVILDLKDKMSGKLGKAVTKINESQKTLETYGKKFEKTGGTIQKTGRTLTAGITAPLAILGTQSVQNFGSVDKSMRLVEQTMGDVKWATGDLTGAMKDAAASSVFSMQEAADASLNFARQGFNAKESAEMLKPALSLAAGTATDLSDVTSGLGNSLKVFSKDGLTAKNAADIFAKAQAQANTTTTDLFNAMKVGGPIVNTVGWKLEDLATITDVFGDAGISGSEGATALKTGLARLVSPAKEGAEWIKKLGINVTNSDGTMKDMVTVQGELNKAFSGLTQEQQIQAASAIFGKNQMGKWLKLIQTAPETVEKYRKSLDDVTGTADNMADALLSGVGGSIEKLKSTFDVTKFNIGEAMGDSVKTIVDKVTGLLEKFNKLDPAMQKNIVKFAGIAAAIGPVTIGVGKVTSTVGKATRKITNLIKIGSKISNFSKGVKYACGQLWEFTKIVGGTAFGKIPGVLSKVKGAFSKVFSILGANPKLLIFLAVAGAIAAIAFLIIKNWNKIKPVLIKVGNWFKNLGTKIKDTFTSVKEKTVDFVTNLVTKIKTFVANAKAQGGVIGAVFQNISNRVNALKRIFNGVITFVKGVFTGDWRKAWQGVKDIFGGIFSSLGSVLKAPLNGVIGLVNGAINRINGISFTVPDWVPVLGGRTFGASIPTIPYLYRGADFFSGGTAVIHDKGAEIVDLPRGTRVIPHDESLRQAYKTGRRAGGRTVSIAKLADTIIVREEADIDRIAEALARKLENLDYTDEDDVA